MATRPSTIPSTQHGYPSVYQPQHPAWLPVRLPSPAPSMVTRPSTIPSTQHGYPSVYPPQQPAWLPIRLPSPAPSMATRPSTSPSTQHGYPSVYHPQHPAWLPVRLPSPATSMVTRPSTSPSTQHGYPSVYPPQPLQPVRWSFYPDSPRYFPLPPRSPHRPQLPVSCRWLNSPAPWPGPAPSAPLPVPVPLRVPVAAPRLVPFPRAPLVCAASSGRFQFPLSRFRLSRRRLPLSRFLMSRPAPVPRVSSPDRSPRALSSCTWSPRDSLS
ncbi:uncharacterized protein LOC130204000 [Pseudoliparis swirei]|uniref:uncharacterized protein LOC130204000 n=1 Tax=Pseudoliparis swirei TaxID=2059687 RepID=UPI0024BE5AC0|nr:uncharacterized protein LOC130204000 [Pseudoliparis swirei]